MAQFNGEVLDYHTASMFLGGRQAKKLANNTYVHCWGEGTAYGIEMAVTLHAHTIARYFTNDAIILSNCGYPTQTTRQRLSKLNRHWNFVQRQGTQYLQNKLNFELVEFHGYVELNSLGNIVENMSVKDSLV